MEIQNFLNVLFRVQRVHRTFFHGVDIRELNLPINKTQTKTLLAIYHHPNNKMSDISRRMSMEKGSFTTLVDHLIELGYVEKERSGEDKRRVRLCLTDSGIAVTKKIEQIFERRGAELLKQLTDDEQQELLQALITIDKCTEKLELNKKTRHPRH